MSTPTEEPHYPEIVLGKILLQIVYYADRAGL